MAWVRFTAPYDFHQPGFIIAYRPGVYNVTSACATLAIARGKAVRLKKPNKDAEPAECPAKQTQED